MAHYEPQPITRLKIKGNRLVVFVSLLTQEIQAKHDGKTVRFADLHEARLYADRKDYDDGIHIKVSQGYGLKPRLNALT